MHRLNQYFDHTLLKPDATPEQIRRLCRQALDYDFYAVCVNGCYVSLAAQELKDSDIKVAAVIGFPLGASATPVKVFEAETALQDGASELDMVLNVGRLKAKDFDFVRRDICRVVETAKKRGALVKVILETGLLSDAEIVKACLLAKEAGAAFVKTSTGFGPGGANPHHVALMKKTVGDGMQVKASGGIRDYETVIALIEAGADRIGASAGTTILDSVADMSPHRPSR